MDSVIETVSKNPSAIGYVSAGTTGIDGVKTLEINGEAVSDNKGKYPLTRSILPTVEHLMMWNRIL